MLALMTWAKEMVIRTDGRNNGKQVKLEERDVVSIIYLIRLILGMSSRSVIGRSTMH